MIGRVAAVCVSQIKGVPKKSVGVARLIEGHGLEGDAHAGSWPRQVSLLAKESIEQARQKWGLKVSSGGFAENITTSGLDLRVLKVGDRLKVGAEAVLEITQKGKKCHVGCQIMKQTGRCIFPVEGVFARVLKSGSIRAEDQILLQADETGS